MKAVVYRRYGDPHVLSLAEVPLPEPQAGQIRVRVHASAATRADTMMRAGTPFMARFATGFPRPKVPITGTGFAGVIDAIGGDVNEFKVGDEVLGETAMGFAANAEYLCIDTDAVVVKKPQAISFEECAPLTDGALTAYNFLLALAGLKAGQRLLVNGASGSLGSAAVQIGRIVGADVTAVCSAANHEWVKALGANQCIDYQRRDFTVSSSPNLNPDADVYDVIFDSVGLSSFAACRNVLSPNGMYLSPVLSLRLLWDMLRTGGAKPQPQPQPKQRAVFAATGLKAPAELKPMLLHILEWMEAGDFKTVIDQAFALSDAPRAHEYIETGRKKGSVVFRSGV